MAIAIGSLDLDAWDVEGDAEVGLTVVGMLTDIAAKSVATSSAVLTGRRLAAAGTTELLTWTGMRERAAREGMAADVRLTEKSEIDCGIVMFCGCERCGSVRVCWRRKRKRERIWEEKTPILIPENPLKLAHSLFY